MAVASHCAVGEKGPCKSSHRNRQSQEQCVCGKGEVSIRLDGRLHPFTRRTGGCHSAAGSSGWTE